MKTSTLTCLVLACLLVLAPVMVVESLAIDKKKIMKALFLAKLAVKKKKLVLLPMPLPIMIEKKPMEHHQMTWEHHGGHGGW